MAQVGLTDSKIAGMKPVLKGQAEIADKIIPGLRVRIGSSGVKTFILRKRVAGRLQNITLGRYHERRFTLNDARKKARSLLVDIEAGKDPTVNLVTPRRGGALAGTIRAMWQHYRDQEVKGKKRSAAEIERTFDKYILPELGDRLADSLTRADVTKLVENVTYASPERATPRMGRAVQQQLSAFYSWALPRLDKLAANPCRDAGRPSLSKSRDRYLTDAEIRAFWQATFEMGPPFGAGFRLLMLTGQRRGEVFEADRSEFTGDVWTVPAARAKNGVPHIVPLSRQAKLIVVGQTEKESVAKLFPSRTNPKTGPSGFSKAHRQLCTEMAQILKVDEVEHFTLHDIRRTVATGMQRLGVPITVVEAVLNHVTGSRAGVAGVYQRHHYFDEKKKALQKWANEVSRLGKAADA